MGVKITLCDIYATDEAGILNNVKIRSSDAEIDLKKLIINGKASVLENLDIDDICNRIAEQEKKMDKKMPEYSGIQRLLNQYKCDKTSFVKTLLQHFENFSEGVAASVVASMLCK